MRNSSGSDSGWQLHNVKHKKQTKKRRTIESKIPNHFGLLGVAPLRGERHKFLGGSRLKEFGRVVDLGAQRGEHMHTIAAAVTFKA